MKVIRWTYQFCTSVIAVPGLILLVLLTIPTSSATWRVTEVSPAGLSRSVSAAHVSQAARGGSGGKRPAGVPSRRGLEASARLAATAPNPARLSLSGQKARSVSRLNGGRDENQPSERPGER